jgi:D-sedoheptulose 7-phosphate isomerase
MTHSALYLEETAAICAALDPGAIEALAAALSRVEGRIYLVGLGGSLSNCQHMAADLRKLCGLDAVAPDNLAELTAWANDTEWAALFDGYLARLGDADALFVLSVGGGTPTVSTPISRALLRAKLTSAKVFGIVGPHGGETARHADIVIRIPVPAPERVTPHTEAFQAVLWHCLVSHPFLQKNKTKW